ncbi:MAG TPA: hypothetical protein VJH92_01575 [Candidatus Nanoarchaeia archaeon]|nr:hypothetical protein [Candidatus Nanoarchaeia archaeon]
MIKVVKSKRGQFYLIAAIVIIGLVAGIFTVANYSQKREPAIVYDLAEELAQESGNFLDRSAISGNYDWESFTGNFSRYVGRDIEVIYIVDETGSNAVSVFHYINSAKTDYTNYTSGSDSVTISYQNSDYDFELREGKDFYFIMSQEIGEERYVATNK